jgi:hypothetical protein
MYVMSTLYLSQSMQESCFVIQIVAVEVTQASLQLVFLPATNSLASRTEAMEGTNSLKLPQAAVVFRILRRGFENT